VSINERITQIGQRSISQQVASRAEETKNAKQNSIETETGMSEETGLLAIRTGTQPEGQHRNGQTAMPNTRNKGRRNVRHSVRKKEKISYLKANTYVRAKTHI